MERKRNQKGFTLAELLIVVAIIAVLVAIAIPIFSAQLEKSREATDLSNIRSAYATLVADYLNNDEAATAKSVSVDAKQKEASWKLSSHELEVMKDGSASRLIVPDYVDTWTSWVVTITNSGDISVSGK